MAISAKELDELYVRIYNLRTVAVDQQLIGGNEAQEDLHDAFLKARNLLGRCADKLSETNRPDIVLDELLTIASRSSEELKKLGTTQTDPPQKLKRADEFLDLIDQVNQHIQSIQTKAAQEKRLHEVKIYRLQLITENMLELQGKLLDIFTAERIRTQPLVDLKARTEAMAGIVDQSQVPDEKTAERLNIVIQPLPKAISVISIKSERYDLAKSYVKQLESLLKELTAARLLTIHDLDIDDLKAEIKFSYPDLSTHETQLLPAAFEPYITRQDYKLKEDIRKLYPGDKPDYAYDGSGTIPEHTQLSEEESKKVEKFNQQFAIIKDILLQGKDEYKLTDEHLQKFDIFYKAVIQRNYYVKQPGAFYSEIKLQMEIIAVRIRDKNITSKLKGEVLRELFSVIDFCGPGIMKHIQKAVEILSDVNSVPALMANFRETLVHQLADRHILEKQISEGHSVHVQNGYALRARDNNWNQIGFESLAAMNEHHLNLAKITSDDYTQFDKNFMAMYTPSTIMTDIADTIRAGIAKRLSAEADIVIHKDEEFDNLFRGVPFSRGNMYRFFDVIEVDEAGEKAEPSDQPSFSYPPYVCRMKSLRDLKIALTQFIIENLNLGIFTTERYQFNEAVTKDFVALNPDKLDKKNKITCCYVPGCPELSYFATESGIFSFYSMKIPFSAPAVFFEKYNCIIWPETYNAMVAAGRLDFGAAALELGDAVYDDQMDLLHSTCDFSRATCSGKLSPGQFLEMTDRFHNIYPDQIELSDEEKKSLAHLMKGFPVKMFNYAHKTDNFDIFSTSSIPNCRDAISDILSAISTHIATAKSKITTQIAIKALFQYAITKNDIELVKLILDKFKALQFYAYGKQNYFELTARNASSLLSDLIRNNQLEMILILLDAEVKSRSPDSTVYGDVPFLKVNQEHLDQALREKKPKMAMLFFNRILGKEVNKAYRDKRSQEIILSEITKNPDIVAFMGDFFLGKAINYENSKMSDTVITILAEQAKQNNTPLDLTKHAESILKLKTGIGPHQPKEEILLKLLPYSPTIDIKLLFSPTVRGNLWDVISSYFTLHPVKTTLKLTSPQALYFIYCIQNGGLSAYEGATNAAYHIPSDELAQIMKSPELGKAMVTHAFVESSDSGFAASLFLFAKIKKDSVDHLITPQYASDYIISTLEAIKTGKKKVHDEAGKFKILIHYCESKPETLLTIWNQFPFLSMIETDRKQFVKTLVELLSKHPKAFDEMLGKPHQNKESDCLLDVIAEMKPCNLALFNHLAIPVKSKQEDYAPLIGTVYRTFQIIFPDVEHIDFTQAKSWHWPELKTMLQFHGDKLGFMEDTWLISTKYTNKGNEGRFAKQFIDNILPVAIDHSRLDILSNAVLWSYLTPDTVGGYKTRQDVFVNAYTWVKNNKPDFLTDFLELPAWTKLLENKQTVVSILKIFTPADLDHFLKKYYQDDQLQDFPSVIATHEKEGATDSWLHLFEHAPADSLESYIHWRLYAGNTLLVNDALFKALIDNAPLFVVHNKIGDQSKVPANIRKFIQEPTKAIADKDADKFLQFLEKHVPCKDNAYGHASIREKNAALWQAIITRSLAKLVELGKKHPDKNDTYVKQQKRLTDLEKRLHTPLDKTLQSEEKTTRTATQDDPLARAKALCADYLGHLLSKLSAETLRDNEAKSDLDPSRVVPVYEKKGGLRQYVDIAHLTPSDFTDKPFNFEKFAVLRTLLKEIKENNLTREQVYKKVISDDFKNTILSHGGKAKTLFTLTSEAKTFYASLVDATKPQHELKVSHPSGL